MIIFILFKNPKKWYQKLILFLFGVKYFHCEFVLKTNNKEYFLRTNFEGNELNENYISYNSKDIDIIKYKINLEQEKKILNYMVETHNKKYNYKDIIKTILFNLNNDNNYNTIKQEKSYNCFQNLKNILFIINRKLYINLKSKEKFYFKEEKNGN